VNGSDTITAFPQNYVFIGRFYHSKIAVEYLSTLANYLEIQIQRKQSYIDRSGTQRINAFHDNDWHFVVPGKPASFKKFRLEELEYYYKSNPWLHHWLVVIGYRKSEAAFLNLNEIFSQKKTYFVQRKKK
jgi:hypothetical protein